MLHRVRRSLRKRLVSPVCRALLQDRERDVGRAILIAGAPRSGTTWIAEVLAGALNGRLMFEPFHPRLVPEFQHYQPFHYARPEEEDDRLFTSCLSVFDGSLRNTWVDKSVTTARPRCRVVKSIRGNLMLAWMRRRFPIIPTLFVMRHPCAVVLSRMHYGWTAEEDLSALLAQPRLVEDYLAPHLALIQGASTAEEKHAILWCITNVVPLSQLGYEELNPLFYAHLCDDRVDLRGILSDALGRDVGALPRRVRNRPSGTTTSNSPLLTGGDNIQHWRTALPSDAIRRILAIVSAFGLDWLYGDGPMPLRSTSPVNAGTA